ncbi:MAG: SDR family oxidoreductase [Pseudomonadota bacterium]
MGRLQGKIALVTGAAQGIGAEIARLMVQEGATVWVTDVQDKLGQELAKSLGPSARYVHLAVEDEVQWQAIAQKIQQNHHRLDILVNNAGVIGLSDNEKHDPEYASLSGWRHVHTINLDGVFLGCKTAIGLMKKQGGSIVNISSRSGMVGVPGACAYASSKAAVRNHTKSVALYCAQNGYNIRCNAVMPGAILTPLWAPMLGETPEQQEAVLNHIAADIPLKRMGQPIDVAYAVVYLASEESGYVTGAELNIDGGILAGSTAAPQKSE